MYRSEFVKYSQDNLIGYVSWPAIPTSPPLPAIIVIHEAWGLDRHIMDVTDRFAKAGYFAIAPDLFTDGSGKRFPQLTVERMELVKDSVTNMPPNAWGDPKARAMYFESAVPDLKKREQINETFNYLTQTMMAEMDKLLVPKLLKTAEWLRKDNELCKNGKVASIGFCMGGALSGRLASADPKLCGAVIFYGNAPNAKQISTISCPVLGIYGQLDKNINGGIPKFAESMKEHGKKFEYHIYDGAAHAFFNDTRAAYNIMASRDVGFFVWLYLGETNVKQKAFIRSLAFFQQNLEG